MIAPMWQAVPWILVAAAAALAVPATVMGDRRSRGVRGVKTAVTALLAVAVAIRVVVRAVTTAAATAAPRGATVATGGGLASSPFSAPAAATPAIGDPTFGAPTAFFYLILIGIVFTVIADWLLAPPENERNFPAGLGAFLIGYLLYGVALLVRVAAIGTGSGATAPAGSGSVAVVAGGGAGVSVGVVAIVYLVVAAVSTAQYTSLTKVPPGLRVPVIGYVAIAANLLAAGVLSAFVSGAGDAGSGYGAVTGALLLVGTATIYLSDSLIAHNLFRKSLFRPELSIMPTYYVGQVSIVAALLLS